MPATCVLKCVVSKRPEQSLGRLNFPVFSSKMTSYEANFEFNSGRPNMTKDLTETFTGFLYDQGDRIGLLKQVLATLGNPDTDFQSFTFAAPTVRAPHH